ncbi:MAG: hypothetical protein IKI11_01950 [Neisseriaceae bacterium]|nr:hypothetical protein [Neisseriaceae bacterium]
MFCIIYALYNFFVNKSFRLPENKVYLHEVQLIDLRSKSVDCKAIKPKFLRACGVS